ncbi:hypothetical protein D3C76_991490 [compost metagenome]
MRNTPIGSTPKRYWPLASVTVLKVRLSPVVSSEPSTPAQVRVTVCPARPVPSGTALPVADWVSFHRVPVITPSPALSRRMYWLGPVPLPVRSPSTAPSVPTLEPAKVVKSSGRLLQVRVASLLAMTVLLGKVTW